MADAKIATVYALALLDLILENSGGKDSKAALESAEQELRELHSILQADESTWDFFRSPVVRQADRQRVLDQAFKSTLSKEVYNMLGVLNSRARLDQYPAVVEAFSKLADEKIGRRRVTVFTAEKLSDADREKLQAAVQGYFDRNIVMDQELRPELIGGLVIRSEGHELDTSIQSRLKRFKQIMLDQKIAGEAYYEN